MSTPISQFPKPEAEQYKGQRKLFLVPIIPLASGVPEEGQKLIERYWTEVRDQIGKLERSLETVTHVYHETLFTDSDEGMKLLESLNPKGHSFVQVMCQSTAKLEITEDRTLVEENADWQRCISIGLASEKVLNVALEGFRDTTQRRYKHISSRIDETLKGGEAGLLFIREDHRIQFPLDVQVFYVSPPALDAIKRWIDDQVRSMAQMAQQPKPDEAE